MKSFAILISGRGSNMEALCRAWRDGRLAAEPTLVISNRAEAPGVVVAREYGVWAEVVSWKEAEVGERETLALLRETGVDFVVLAGFMRVLGAHLIGAYPGKIINIHPSLLPAFPGLYPQRQALAHGVRVSGCTTHFVTEGVDSGPIILQRAVPVRGDDTEASLSQRILVEEHRLIVETVQLMAEDRLRVLDERHVQIVDDNRVTDRER